jgi:hypothetical protein
VKIEVIIDGKCSVTVRTTDDDYTKAEVLAAARGLARVATQLVKDTGGSLKKQPFGFHAAPRTEDQSRCHDDVPAELPEVDRDVPGGMPGDAR